MFKFPVMKFRNTIFFRIIITYILVICPIVLLGFYLYYWSYENASDDISRATVTQLNYYLEDLNREVEWMEVQQYDLLEDDELKKLAVTYQMMSSVERRETMVYLLHRLTFFKASSPYIKDIKIHIPSINKTLSAVHSVVELEMNNYQVALSQVSKHVDRLLYIDPSLHLIASKHVGDQSNSPIFMIQIVLDSEMVSESLQQITLYPDSGAFLISDSNFRAMNSEESAPILQSYMMQPKSGRESTTLLTHSRETYHIDKSYSDKLKMTVATYIPEETVKRPLSFFYRWVWLFVFTSSIAVIIVWYSTYRLIHKPLLFFVQSFRRMEEGELDSHIHHDKKDEFGYLYTRFNHMLIKLKGLIDQDYKQKMMMQRSELKQLQSQINPHFLYNSFFILNSLAKVGDVQRIEQFTVMLGEYFRFITRNGDDLVPLLEEIKHSKMYTNIQELRFSRRISVQFDEFPDEIANVKVPRLIVQPLIENAYEHSLEKMSEGGLLHISFKVNKQQISIIIEDNGDSLSDEQLKIMQDKIDQADKLTEMTGILNIHRRLVLTFGEGSGLSLERSELKGLKSTIIIQLDEQDNI